MKKRAVLICLLYASLFCFSLIAVAGAENGIDGFNILDEVSFSTPKDGVEEIMKEHGFEKVEQYDAMVTVANTLVFYKGDPVFGNTVNTVWYEYTDNTYTTISQMLVRYAANADVCSQVINCLDNMYGNHLVDTMSGQGTIYVWYHDDVKLYIRGALFGDTLEDAEKGEAQSQIVIIHLDEPVAGTDDVIGSAEETSDKAENVLSTDNQNATDSINLSNMSFDELVTLKEQINLAIWNCQEWQEVRVPTGLYKVGEDIPAGKWTILAPEGTTNYVKWGTKPDASGTHLERWEGNEMIYSTSYKKYDPNKHRSQLDIELFDGMYFYVEDGAAIFTPYAGKPDLGFK